MHFIRSVLDARLTDILYGVGNAVLKLRENKISERDLGVISTLMIILDLGRNHQES